MLRKIEIEVFMKRLLCVILLIHCITNYSAIAQKMNYSIVFGDMGATMYPFQQVFNNTFFPYLKLSGEYNYVQKNKSTFFQVFDFNNMYHSTIGFISGLGTAGGYRYSLTSKFSMDITLGVGFSLIFPQSKQYKKSPDGSYSEKRPVFIKASVFSSFGLAYELPNENSIFLSYGYNTFINYNRSVSFLPYESLMIGYRLNPKP
jgi:hypothetical protein